MPRPSTRGKLIDAGLAVLHAQGFHGCSIQDIVDAAGVPKGSFFNHFKSKELLALEALQAYGATSRMEMLADPAQAPLERLRGHFEFLARGYEHHRFERGCLIGNLATEVAHSHGPLREALRSAFDYWCDAVAGCVREAQQRGEVAPEHDAQQLARFLVNAWQGAVMRAKVVRGRAPIDEFFAVSFGLLLAAPEPARRKRPVVRG